MFWILITFPAAYRQSVAMVRAEGKKDATGKACLEDVAAVPTFQTFVPPAQDGGPVVPLFLQDWSKGKTFLLFIPLQA